MGAYKYITKLWKQPIKNLGQLYKDRLIEWRKQPSTVRVEKPTRLDRARSLGYRAKQGIIVVRQKVPRGGHRRSHIHRKGRRSKHYHLRLTLIKNYQQIAEERAVRKYPNCEVLNSYWLAKDPLYYWYEIIMVDKSNPSILSDKTISWIAQPQHKRRVFRGLTSSSTKSRIKIS